MWLTIGLTTSAVLAFVVYWLERRDRIKAEEERDHKAQALFEGDVKLASNERRRRDKSAEEGRRFLPYDGPHQFLYRDGDKDMWLGERNIDGVGWTLCIFATMDKGIYHFNPISNVQSLRNSNDYNSRALVHAYDWAKAANLLPRYEKPYKDQNDANHYFLGQFHGVDLWYVQSMLLTNLNEGISDRIASCYPSLPSKPKDKLEVYYRAITCFSADAFVWCNPQSTALQIGYDLAAERGLVKKINHG